MARSRTIWKGGQLFAEYVDGELTYLNPDYRPPARSSAITMPYVVRDIGEYRSPLDGSMITSRSQHRDHMRAHDVIEVGNERMPAAAPPQAPSREIGEVVKRRLDEVKSLPQREYDTHVQQQQAEHAEIASLVTATPQG